MILLKGLANNTVKHKCIQQIKHLYIYIFAQSLKKTNNLIFSWLLHQKGLHPFANMKTLNVL